MPGAVYIAHVVTVPTTLDDLRYPVVEGCTGAYLSAIGVGYQVCCIENLVTTEDACVTSDIPSHILFANTTILVIETLGKVVESAVLDATPHLR
jgi:hypothetical protein